MHVCYLNSLGWGWVETSPFIRGECLFPIRTVHSSPRGWCSWDDSGGFQWWRRRQGPTTVAFSGCWGGECWQIAVADFSTSRAQTQWHLVAAERGEHQRQWNLAAFSNRGGSMLWQPVLTLLQWPVVGVYGGELQKLTAVAHSGSSWRQLVVAFAGGPQWPVVACSGGPQQPKASACSCSPHQALQWRPTEVAPGSSSRGDLNQWHIASAIVPTVPFSVTSASGCATINGVSSLLEGGWLLLFYNLLGHSLFNFSGVGGKC